MKPLDDKFLMHRFSGENLKLSWDEYYLRYYKNMDDSTRQSLITSEKVYLERIVPLPECDYDFIKSHKSLLFWKVEALIQVLKCYPFKNNELIEFLGDSKDYVGIPFVWMLSYNESIDIELVMDKYPYTFYIDAMMQNKNFTEDIILKYWDFVFLKDTDYICRKLLSSYPFSLKFLKDHLTKFEISDSIEYVLRNNNISEETLNFFKSVNELLK